MDTCACIPVYWLADRVRAGRVEPSAASHMFVVHGKACEKRPEHQTCTHTRSGANPAGRMYILDFRPLMGTDWRVRLAANVVAERSACVRAGR